MDPRQPVRLVRIPQQLPYGLSAEGLGLRHAFTGMGFVCDMAMPLDGRFVGAEMHEFATAYLRHAPPDSGYRFLREIKMGPPRGPEMPKPEAPEKRAPGAEERPPLERPPVPPTEVRGRGLLQGHWIRIETAVVEFEVVRGALEWSPEHAVLVFRDGRRREVEIDRSASTWTGPVEQGRLIRLALRIRPDEISGVELVEVRCGEETLRILL